MENSRDIERVWLSRVPAMTICLGAQGMGRDAAKVEFRGKHSCGRE